MADKFYVIGVFGRTVEEVLAGPYDSFETAAKVADVLWRDDYNYGRSRHTPSMGHNSGITSIKIANKTEGNNAHL